MPFIIVLFDNVVNPDTFNDDTKVVLFDYVVKPLTFNDDVHETLSFNEVIPVTCRVPPILVLPVPSATMNLSLSETI